MTTSRSKLIWPFNCEIIEITAELKASQTDESDTNNYEYTLDFITKVRYDQLNFDNLMDVFGLNGCLLSFEYKVYLNVKDVIREKLKENILERLFEKNAFEIFDGTHHASNNSEEMLKRGVSQGVKSVYEIVILYNLCYYRLSAEHQIVIDRILASTCEPPRSCECIIIEIVANGYATLTPLTKQCTFGIDEIAEEKRYYYNVTVDGHALRNLNCSTLILTLGLFQSNSITFDYNKVSINDRKNFLHLHQHFYYLRSKIIHEVLINLVPFDFVANEDLIWKIIITGSLQPYLDSDSLSNLFTAFQYMFQHEFAVKSYVYWGSITGKQLENVVIKADYTLTRVIGNGKLLMSVNWELMFERLTSMFMCFGAYTKAVTIIMGDYLKSKAILKLIAIVEKYCKQIEKIDVANRDNERGICNNICLDNVKSTEHGMEYFRLENLNEESSLLKELQIKEHAITDVNLTAAMYGITENSFELILKLPWLKKLTIHAWYPRISNWHFIRRINYKSAELKYLRIANHLLNFDYHHIEELLDNWKASVVSLDTLKLIKWHLRAQLFNAISLRPKRIIMNGCEIDEDVRICRSHVSSNLKQLRFRNMNVPYSFMDDDDVNFILNLEVDFKNCGNITNVGLFSILSNNSNIKLVFLENCTSLTDDFFYVIFEKSKNDNDEIQHSKFPYFTLRNEEAFSPRIKTMFHNRYVSDFYDGDRVVPKLLKLVTTDGINVISEIVFGSETEELLMKSNGSCNEEDEFLETPY